MKRIQSFSEKGQSLIFVALLMFVFLGVLALVLDGGYMYYQRRIAQNAADAGALAGARAKCKNEDPRAAAESVVNQNDAVFVSIDYPGEYEVHVRTRMDINSFFANILQNPPESVSAEATAACDTPGYASGIIPIAWRCIEQAATGDWNADCEMHYIQNGDDCKLGEDPIYVFIDADPNGGGTGTFYDCAQNPNPYPGATLLNCDSIDPGNEQDIYIIDNARSDKSWYWIDLLDDNHQPDTSQLSSWIDPGFDGTIKIHTWLFGRRGVIASLYVVDVHNQKGNILTLPVFNDQCENGYPQNQCPEKMHPEDEVYETGNESSGDLYFHLISYALFQVNCAKGNKCPANKNLGSNLSPNEKTIEGCFVEGVIPGGGGGGDGDYAGAVTIYLIK